MSCKTYDCVIRLWNISLASEQKEAGEAKEFETR